MTSQKQIKIMIIDDTLDFCAMAKQALSKSGFNVIKTTNDAAAALNEIPEMRPDVVLFDLILSKMDGIAFLQKALHMTRSTGTKYIAVSTISGDAIIRQIMQMGASYYMVKPVNFDVLCERIHMIVGEKLQPASIQIKAPEESEDLEKQVTTAILEIGIPAHVKGYHYVRSAIMLAIKSPDAMNAVTKIIYPTIAKMYQTSASRVERAIRHAIEVAWDRGNIDTLNAIFGYSISSNRGKPTNSEFIAMLADRIRLKNKKTSSAEEMMEIPHLL